VNTRELCEYYRVEASHKYGCTDQVTYRSISIHVSECDAPKDSIQYDSSGCVRSVVLWGKNLNALKKAAEYMLCGENEPMRRNRFASRQPATTLLFSAA
jgi:hypothetical protein